MSILFSILFICGIVFFIGVMIYICTTDDECYIEEEDKLHEVCHGCTGRFSCCMHCYDKKGHGVAKP